MKDITQKLSTYLHGQGNTHLTIILFALLAIGLGIALFAPPEIKILFILWWVLP